MRTYFYKSLKIIKATLLFNTFFVFLYFICLYKLYYILNKDAQIILWLYGVVVGFFLLSRFVIAFYYRDEHKKRYAKNRYPNISFVIACKNEEHSILKTINTCLFSKYPGKMECIAINDGSTDGTAAQMRLAKRKWGKKLRIVKFETNRGKREAMAEGVLAAASGIIIFVDSDSFVRKNAAKVIVEHFLEDENIGAVAGNTLAENSRRNMLTKMQSARYGVSFDIFKASESVFGAVTCCPGCFSAYRKVAILEVLDLWRFQTFFGTQSTFGDDRSLTNFILRRWQVIYCRKAKVRTIVPENYKQFIKQQLRWKKSWIREGVNAGSFMWKKNFIAAISFYVNLLIPIFAPLMAFKAIFIEGLFSTKIPTFYLLGLVVMSLLFGLYYFFISLNKNWWFIAPFSLIYTFMLLWQMPYAIVTVRNTKWGTR